MDKSILATVQPLGNPVFNAGTRSHDTVAAVQQKIEKESEQGAGSAVDNVRGFFGNILNRTLAIMVFLTVWELLPRFGLFDPMFFPPFSDVVKAFYDALASGELFTHIAASLKRSFTGLFLAVVIAVPLGIFIGWFGRFEQFLDPLLQVFRNTSTFALMPVFIIFFGINEVSKIAIILWGCTWPLLINSISGVKNVDPLLVKSARSMGTSNFWLFFKVILPASTPGILTGFRLSATHSILILVASEMMGASSGLGYMIHYQEQMFNIPAMYAGVVTLSLIGLAMNFVIVKLDSKILSWKQTVTE
ncbi:MAG: ABC transporter permease [Desulfuromonadaceae bacterium]